MKKLDTFTHISSKELPKVNCGLFGIAEDHMQSYLSLDEKLIKNKASTFFFEASGDSMAPYIHKKDILVVDRSLEATNNKVIVAALDGGLICKRIIRTIQGVFLVSDNPKFKSIPIKAERDFYVWGVVSAIIREVNG